MREIRPSGLMGGEGKRVARGTAPLIDSTGETLAVAITVDGRRLEALARNGNRGTIHALARVSTDRFILAPVDATEKCSKID